MLYDIATGLFYILVMTGSFAALDKFITKVGFAKPYYAVHTLHNAAIVALTAPDVRDSFLQRSAPMNWSSVQLCYALHLYHTALYWRTFRYDDWLHHITMMVVALPLGCASGAGTGAGTGTAAGPLIGFSLFFTTGLPGGVSYAALWAERNGWIGRAAEKNTNRLMNIWIRAPGCVAQAALTVASVLSQPAIPQWQVVIGCVDAAFVAWNGLYFMQQAVVASALLLDQ